MSSVEASMRLEEGMGAASTVDRQATEAQEQQDERLALILAMLLEKGKDVGDEDIPRALDGTTGVDKLELRNPYQERPDAERHDMQESCSELGIFDKNIRDFDVSANGSGKRVLCLSCLDPIPAFLAVCAGDDADIVSDAAGTGTTGATCGHFFCTSCMSAYVLGAVRDRKYPILCPMSAGPVSGGEDGQGATRSTGGASSSYSGRSTGGGSCTGGIGSSSNSGSGSSGSSSIMQGCGRTLSRESVVALLLEHPRELQDFELLEVENSPWSEGLLYCPHPDCSCPMLIESAPPPEQPVICPACVRGFCLNCRITGWHEGLTCGEFQSLPDYMRSESDVGFLRLSKQQRWTPCPGCKHMVERLSGCNHMTCRCGTQYCYSCGTAYVDRRKSCGC